jgi:hypothetical protein
MKKFTLIKLVKKILTIVWRLICIIKFIFLGVKSKAYFDEPHFGIGDATVLKVLLNRLPPQNKNIKILEVGSWIGNGSTIILGEFAKERDGMLYCVDTWTGSSVEKSQSMSQSHDIYGTFEYNIKSSGLGKHVTPLRMTSFEASEIIKDNFFDFIFIDGDHTYEIVKQDILNFSKKLKSNGILCGHDCEGLMEDFDPSIINENLNSGYFKDPQAGFPQRTRDIKFPDKLHSVGICAGVIKSVSEIFGSNDSLIIWSKIDLRKEQGELLSLILTERWRKNNETLLIALGLDEHSCIWSVTLEDDV